MDKLLQTPRIAASLYHFLARTHSRAAFTLRSICVVVEHRQLGIFLSLRIELHSPVQLQAVLTSGVLDLLASDNQQDGALLEIHLLAVHFQ